MILETIEDFELFKSNSHGDWIIHIVPIDPECHPRETSISLLFIRTIAFNQDYCYAFNHPDSKSSIDRSTFLKFLTENENNKWTLDKKSLSQCLELQNLFDLNLSSFLSDNVTHKADEFITTAHKLIKRQTNDAAELNKIIPLMKHLESFQSLCDKMVKSICQVDIQFLIINNMVLDSLSILEKNGIFVDSEIFKKYYSVVPNKDGLVFSQYNIYTSTGRPSNRFGGVNYAALNASNGCRAAFRSRYGNNGKLVVIDYTAFHPRIICLLTKYRLDVDVNIYEYLAKLYFQKKQVDHIDIAESKKITFRQLYGGVEQKYSHIKYLGNLKKYIDEQWNFFENNRYVLTPIFKRKITDKHIKNPNPCKLFNYILQGVEGEIAISKMRDVLLYLRNKKTKAVMYTYDSLIYDFHNDDGMDTINDLRKIMGFNGLFPTKTYIGDTYQSVDQVNQ